jgi:hypothetical protein
MNVESLFIGANEEPERMRANDAVSHTFYGVPSRASANLRSTVKALSPTW